MNKYLSFFLVGLLSSPTLVFAMTLDEFLLEVQKRHKDFQAFQSQQQAAEDRRVARDLGLSPVLTLGASYLSDEAEPQTVGTKVEARQYNLGVAKEFTTGTKTSVTAKLQQTQIRDVPAAMSSLADYSTSGLGVALSQSLWKNFFGEGTRLSQARQAAASKLEQESFSVQQRQVLIEAETAYWDYLYQRNELMAREESLSRARKIERWLKRRYQDGINDKADYLNGQALTVSRELLLASARDQVLAAERKVRLFLEMDGQEKLPALASDFKAPRDPQRLVGGGGGRVMRVDAQLAALEAKVRDLGAREAADQLKPDLVLQASYGTNSGLESETGTALNRITNTDLPTTKVGLSFTYIFDTDAKLSQEAVFRKEALAAQLKSERKALESETAWSELLRRYGELLKQIETAGRISEIQSARAREQSLKLSRGRAVTSDVVNSEEDASNSVLTLNRLHAEARKIEAQSRLFVRVSE